jgi:hypothetical protein
MKKQLFFLFTFSMLRCIALTAQVQFESSKIDSSLLRGAVAVVRLFEENFEVNKIGRATQKVRRVITILKKDGEKYAGIAMQYSKYIRIDKLQATLYDASGKKVKILDKSDIKDVASEEGEYSDTRIKIASLDFFQYPFTIDFEYEIEFKGTMFFPSFEPQLAPNVSVEKSKLNVEVPEDYQLRYTTYDEQHFLDFRKFQKGNSWFYEWTSKPLTTYKIPDFAPHDYAPTPSVRLAPSDFKMGGFEGNFTSWENYSSYVYELNKERDEITPEIQQTVNSLITDCKTERAKVEKIYNFLQNSTRYINIAVKMGGWQPEKAENVQKNKFGDCKGLSNYMKTMLRAAGIASIYAIISAGSDETDIDTSFPSAQFNHAILLVPLANDTIWLECTNQHYAAGWLGDFTHNRHALLVLPQGGKLLKTPVYSKKENYCNKDIFVKISENGQSKVIQSAQYKGILYEKWQQISTLNEKEQQEVILKTSAFSNQNIDKLKIDIKELSLPVAAVNVESSINNYAIKSGKRLFVPINPVTRWTEQFDLVSNRIAPIQLSDTEYQKQDNIKIEIPEGYVLEGKWNDVLLQTPFGNYEMKVSIQNNIIQVTRSVQLNNSCQTANKIEEAKVFCQKMFKTDATRLTFVEAKQ